MLKWVLILLVALLFESVGVVFLSKGLKVLGGVDQVSAASILRLIGRGAANPQILLGVFFEAVFFGFLLYLLAQEDVSVIWPMTSLGFVITAIAARIFLHEQISPMRWTGVMLIVIGAAFVTWSEHKNKAHSPDPPGVEARLSRE